MYPHLSWKKVKGNWDKTIWPEFRDGGKAIAEQILVPGEINPNEQDQCLK